MLNTGCVVFETRTEAVSPSAVGPRAPRRRVPSPARGRTASRGGALSGRRTFAEATRDLARRLGAPGRGCGGPPPGWNQWARNDPFPLRCGGVTGLACLPLRPRPQWSGEGRTSGKGPAMSSSVNWGVRTSSVPGTRDTPITSSRCLGDGAPGLLSRHSRCRLAGPGGGARV